MDASYILVLRVSHSVLTVLEVCGIHATPFLVGEKYEILTGCVTVRTLFRSTESLKLTHMLSASPSPWRTEVVTPRGGLVLHFGFEVLTFGPRSVDSARHTSHPVLRRGKARNVDWVCDSAHTIQDDRAF